MSLPMPNWPDLLAEMQHASQQRDQALFAYQAVVQLGWQEALTRFFVGSRSEPPKTWRGWADRWLQVANETLIESRRSDEFVEAQRRLVRSASDYSLHERKLAESWCEACHLPTRSEVDELQRRVIELRRELRLQRRAAAG